MIANKRYIDADIQSRYAFFDYGHALEILHESFPVEWKEIQEALRRLQLTLEDISKAGGMRRQFQRKLTLFCILMVGEKFAFAGISL